ncbi:MAG: F0F1 ATP synthase subunit epsilon [Rubricella sp.]
MADTMQFDLVSPERMLDSREVTSVQIPGMDGDLTAMPNHAPFLTTLRPGVVTVKGDGGEAEYVVTGGFADVTPEGVAVLAERAMPRADATAEDIAALIERAEEDLENASAENKLIVAQRVRDLKLLADSIA